MEKIRSSLAEMYEELLITVLTLAKSSIVTGGDLAFGLVHEYLAASLGLCWIMFCSMNFGSRKGKCA